MQSIHPMMDVTYTFNPHISTIFMLIKRQKEALSNLLSARKHYGLYPSFSEISVPPLLDGVKDQGGNPICDQ